MNSSKLKLSRFFFLNFQVYRILLYSQPTTIRMQSFQIAKKESMQKMALRNLRSIQHCGHDLETWRKISLWRYISHTLHFHILVWFVLISNSWIFVVFFCMWSALRQYRIHWFRSIRFECNWANWLPRRWKTACPSQLGQWWNRSNLNCNPIAAKCNEKCFSCENFKIKHQINYIVNF